MATASFSPGSPSLRPRIPLDERALRAMLNCPMTDIEIQQTLLEMGRRARAAAHELVKLTTAEKNAILLAMADEIEARQAECRAPDVGRAG